MTIVRQIDVSLPKSRAGDEDFGAELVRHQAPLLSLARRLCWSGTEAEDMVQQTLLKGWTYRTSFTPGTDLGAWLRTILRNEVCSEGRRQVRRPVRPFVHDVDDPVCPPSQEWSLAIRDLQRQLAELVPEQVEALVLVSALGHDHAQAAQMAGCALGTMKSRVSRARTCLRSAVEARELEA